MFMASGCAVEERSFSRCTHCLAEFYVRKNAAPSKLKSGGTSTAMEGNATTIYKFAVEIEAGIDYVQ
jgi:hypothetical protein